MTIPEAKRRILSPGSYNAQEIREAMERLAPGSTCQLKTHKVAPDRRSGITRTGIVVTLIEMPRWQPISSYV